MPISRVVAIVAAVVALLGAGALSLRPEPQAAIQPLPERLSDAEFWELSTRLSEPAGYFRSENLVSNEHTFQYVLPALAEAARPGGAYLGVAPDQNFTFMLAVRPRIAFLVDIRRGNLLQHLMYKALFEMATDRADFISRLFSKPRPEGLGAASGITDLLNAFAGVATSEPLYRENLAAIAQHLTERHGFPLSEDDLQHLETIYFAFFWQGPGLRYSTSRSGFGGRGFGRTTFPSWEDLMVQTDSTGQQRSYLASEEHFRTVREWQQRNLIVPVVGNFAGPRALRAVGQYLREHGTAVSAFYVSNVEQYLFQDGLFDAFAGNVATLPIDDRSTFIRSVSGRFGYQGPHQWRDGRATALHPIRTFLADAQAGVLRTYWDLNSRSR